MKTYIQHGAILTVTAPAEVASGDGVLIGSLFGVSQIAAASGAEITIVTQGVIELAKTAAQEWSVGDKIYWNDTTKKATTAASGNTLIGVAVAAAANPSDVGAVKLTGQG